MRRSPNVPERVIVALPMARDCMVWLLGGFRVELDGRPVAADAWRHRRGADLVKLLALAPQHRLHRDQVMEAFWPELATQAAAANLRKAVHYGRRALGGKDSIASDGDLLVLWPVGQLRVDTERFDGEATRALSSQTGLDSALALFPGDLLPEDRYADWTEPHRERLHGRRLELLRASARWDEILEIDRTDEQACRALMRSQLERGNRHGAIRQFQRLRDILRVDLGVAPEAETVALFEQAIATAGPSTSAGAERAQALLANGLVQWHERQLDAAQRFAEEARALALGHRLGRELGEASSLLGMVAMARGRWAEVFIDEFMAAIQLGADQAPFILDAHLCLAEASLNTSGESTAALAHGLLDQAVAAKSTRAEALISLLIGEADFFASRLDESDEWLSRAADLYQRVGGGSGRAFAMIRWAEVASARQQRPEAERRLNTARQLMEESALESHLRARVLEAMIKTSDNPERSQIILGEAEYLIAHPKEMCRPCSIGLGVAASIACARANELARSRHWLDYADRLASMWSGTPWQAAVWEARGTLRLAEGDQGQALALLREASHLFAECGRPLDEARCQSAIAAAS